MPKCEICETDVLRRRRNSENKLVCRICFYRNYWSKEELIKKTRKLEIENEDLESQIPPFKPQIEYRYNSPFSAIPPKDVLKNAIIALDIGKYYSEFSTVLGDYYGIEGPRYLIDDDEIPKGAIACYHNRKNVVYAFKNQDLHRETAFHEFYHAIQNFGIVSKIDSEKNADLYAKGCMKRLEES